MHFPTSPQSSGGKNPNRLGNPHVLSTKHLVSARAPYILDTGRLSMQGTLCLPLTITLSIISRFPVTCLTRHHTSPAPPGLVKPCCLPSLSLFSCLSLTLSTIPPGFRMDGQLLPPFDGLWRADRDESGVFQDSADLLTLFEDD